MTISALALRPDFELLPVRVGAPPQLPLALRATHLLLLCLHYFQCVFTILLFCLW